VVIPVSHDARRRTLESANETACGDEDLASDVLGKVTDEIGVRGSDVLGRRGIERALRADVVEQTTAIQLTDVRFVVRTGGQPCLRAGANHVRPHAVRLELGGDRQRQAVDATLACRVPGAAVVAEERERAGVDDRTTTPFDQLRRRRPARLERRAEVRVE